MKLKMASAFVLIAIIVFGSIVFNSKFSRFQLAYWWWLWGVTQQDINSVEEDASIILRLQKESFLKKQISSTDLSDVKQRILETLKSHNYDQIGFDAALGFASVFQDDPQVQEHLIIIAFDHPDRYVRCKWQLSLKTGHDLLIVTTDGEGKTASRYSLRNAEDCESLKETHN